MDYPKSTPNVGLVGGKFVDENVGTGTPGSLIPATWGNAVTDELLAVIKAAGIVPTEGDLTQLLKAIQAIAASDIKRSVRVATTGPIALSGLQTIDGVALKAGDRLLVKDQANPAQNWIYIASAAAWTRALDASESEQCTPGHMIVVQAGTVGRGTVWQLANDALPQLGATALVFTQALGRTGVAPGIYTKVQVGPDGRVQAGSNPDTLAGSGILDAYTKTEMGEHLTEIIAAIRGGVSGSLDQLSKVAAALNNDPKFAANILLALSGKAGKGTTLADYGITDAIPNINPLPGGSYDVHADNYAFISSPNESSVAQNAYWNGTQWVKHSSNKAAIVIGGVDGAAFVRKWAAGVAPGAAPSFGADIAEIIDAGMQATPADLDEGVSSKKWVSVGGLAYYFGRKLKAAGEAIAGITRFATLNEVVTGASGYLAVCPSYLMSGFGYRFDSAGYIKLPAWMGGLMIQWCESYEPSSETDYRYFPVPFTSVVYGAWLQVNSGTFQGFSANYGTVLGVTDLTRYLWTAAGTWGGGGKGWIFALGR
ncbi:hypothetical protein WLF18_01485 [Pseudomonas shirazensis]|uniref:Phage tail protein n=1 Tax=Pseudomonas shirazensis TaxID=2745494 RepID=A0ABU8ZUX3_9PSED